MTDSGSMLFPPTGIAHVSKSLLDFVRPLPEDPEVHGIVVSASAQPNSVPHLGTITTVLSAFAVAKLARDQLGVDAEVLFDSLDNAPARADVHDDVLYQTSLSDEPSPERALSLSDYYFESIRKVIEWAAAEAHIPWVRRTYYDFQASPAIRQRVLAMGCDHDRFAQIANPDTRQLHLRIPCPQCLLIDKYCSRTTIEAGDSELLISSFCPVHEQFSVTFSVNNSVYIDLNTPIRDIAKCAEFIDWRRDGRIVVMIDGGDWGGSWAWEVVMKALAWLAEDLRWAPTRLFAPLILDGSGAKLSKSIYVGSDAYKDLPSWVLNLAGQPDEEFLHRMSRLWGLVTQWVDSPQRFFRNYSLTALI